MIHPIEYRGSWFIPTKPRSKIAGVLRFTPSDKIYLELDGVFQEDHDHLAVFNRDMRDEVVILGVTSTGVKITLYKCVEINFKYNTSSKYLVHAIITGDHFKSEEKIVFAKLRVAFANLEEWVGVNVVKSKHGETARELLVHCEAPTVIPVTTSGKQQISLEAVWHARFDRDRTTIQEETFFNIKFSHPTNLVSCLDLLRGIQDFLGVAMSKPPFPTRIEAWEKASSAQKVITILFIPVLAYNPKKKYFNEMLFTSNDIRETSDKFVNNWLERREILKPVYNLYFANLHNPSIYTENRFLNLTQAIETYHRRVFGGKYMDDNEFLEGLYKDFVASIPAHVNKEFRESLTKGKFRYANEYSLRKRLTELLKKYHDSLPINFLGSNKARIGFIGKVIDTRNYLTHYDETSKENIAKGTDLFYLEQGLKVIMEVILLTEIGFASEKIREIITKSEAYRLFDKGEAY